MKRSIVAIVVLMAWSITNAGVAKEVTYRKDIRPLWEEMCASCHDADSPYLGDFAENKKQYVDDEKGPRMDTYADLLFFIGWPDTGAIMRRLDDGKSTKDGKPGNMYEHLGTDEKEQRKNLKIFKAWVGEDAWNLNRWKARGDVPAATKKQITKMKLRY